MGLKQMFKGMDTDNSGTITIEELKQGLAKQGTKLTEQEVKQLMEAVSYLSFSKYCIWQNNFPAVISLMPLLKTIYSLFSFCILQADADGNGTIDYDEFITATMHMNRMNKEDHLYTAFQYFDKDNSG